MSQSVAEIVKRIEQGEDFESISRSLISPAERALLKCCAIVRTFDESLVNNYFRRHIPDSETISFDKLITRAFVQRVPRSDDVNFLQPVIQKQYYDAWWESQDGVPQLPRSEVPRALCELSTSLVDYYRSQGEDAKLDLLGQLVFVDKDEAWRLFEELYKAADDVFDLARCRDIINVLTGRENVLGGLSKSLNDTDRYLQSRTLWATEYYQTVSYYERKELKDEFESFLAQGSKAGDPNRKWILHVHAPGGLGKTMFVRWLISRRCAPRPYTIPCGRIDFDFVDRITSSQHRWRLFLAMARALEVQLPGNFFHSLITKFTDYENILSHAETGTTDSPTPTHLPPRERLEEEILYLFGTALKDANLAKPIILIFDTLEEVILYHPDDLLELVRQVNEVRKLYPDLFLILSGRYDLTAKDQGPATRLPEFGQKFGEFTQTIRVEPFAKDEALGYLQEKKKLTKDRPLDIVVARSEGNPFKLALFADILIDDPKITADTIRDYPSVDLLYLIERVLARIPNKKLHWLLRYGVVPRKLTRAFAEDVIKKHLLRRIAGDSSQDNPSRYKPLTEKVQATVKQKKIFEVAGSSEQDINMDELWAELKNYASSYAWVTTEPSDQNTVVFHGDVVNPMRRWLEDEPVYDLLHEDAISYFENKARTDPKDRVKWMQNAVYHKFQREGAEAAAYWRNVLADESNSRARRDLAREVIGSEYVDENFKPRRLLNNKEIISVSTLVEAYYELASSAIEIARSENLGASNAIWSEADFDLKKCEQLQDESAEVVVSAADIAALRAAILTSQNRGEGAITIVETAIKTKISDQQLLRLRIELATALSSLGNHQEAERQLIESLGLAKRANSSAAVFVDIYRRLARLHRAERKLQLSVYEIENAQHHVALDDKETWGQLLFELGNLYFEMGEFNRSLKTIERTRGLPASLAPINDIQYSNYLARLFLASGDPTSALELSRSYSIPDESTALLDSLLLEQQEQRGMAHRQLFAIEAARQAFELARSRWREIGNSKAAQRCMLKKAELWLSVVGDVREGATTLNESARLTIEYDAEQTLELSLLSLKQFHLQSSDVQGAIDASKKHALQKAWNDELRAKLILGIGPYQVSPNDSKSSNEFFADVAEKLKKVEPASARILLLEPLKDYPTCKKLNRKVVEALISLVPLDEADEDFKIHAPKVAELLRVLGRKDAALALLNKLNQHLRNWTWRARLSENTFALRNMLLIRGKTSFVKGATDELNEFVEAFLREFSNYPTLCASTLVEFAELPYTTRSISARLEWLNKAQQRFSSEGIDSQWMARLFAARGKLTIKRNRQEALGNLTNAISQFRHFGQEREVIRLNDFIAKHDASSRSVSIGGDVVGTIIVGDRGKISASEARSVTIHVEDNWTETVKIKTILSGEDVVTREVPIEPGTLLDRLLAFDTYENYSFSFLREMDENWIQACTQMGPVLIDAKAAQQFQDPRGTALCLMIDALQLSSPPWEMMVMPSSVDHPASLLPGVTHLYRSLGPKLLRNISDVAWLQKALSRFGKVRIPADGVLGFPQTKQALVRFQRDQKLPDHGVFDGLTRRKLKQFLRSESKDPRPRVLLLRPSIDRQRASSRGHEFFGFSSEDSYRQERLAQVMVVEDPDVKEVERHVHDFKPDVIHILSTVEESTSIGIFLDFITGGTGIFPEQTQGAVKSAARQKGASRSDSVDFLTLSALAEMIRKQQTPDRARPLLILDVLEPPGRTDLFTQLFLRNAFAAQLFQHGVFESIIACGLTPPQMQEKMSRTLVSGLAEYQAVGEIVNRMRRLADLGNYSRLPDVQGVPGPLRNSSERDYLSTVVATAGISLFTQDPEM